MYIRISILTTLLTMGIFAYTQNLEQIGATKAFQLNGSVSANGTYYTTSSEFAYRSPFSYVLSGNLNAKIYEVNLPFSFTYSEQERNVSQPFNQFGISPHYKWMKGHLGYRNIQFSEYTLSGHQLLGAGIELNPKNVRFGFIGGRLKRAVSPDPNSEFLVLPSFKRMGWSAKIGYGTSTDYVDIILLKASDQANSILLDSTNQYMSPEENGVIGIAARKKIIKNISFELDAAISGTNKDARQSQDVNEQNSSIESYPIMGTLIKPNASYQQGSAIKSSLHYYGKLFNLSTTYNRIDPGFRSHGTYYMYTDIERITFIPSFSLFKYKMNVNGTWSLQRDNLYTSKKATTNHINSMVSISYNPIPALGFVLMYNNMNIKQKDGKDALTDYERMHQSNPMITLTSYYTIADSLKSHSFNVTLSRMELKDKNPFTAPYSNYFGINSNVSYSYTLYRLNMGLFVSYNTNYMNFSTGDNTSHGFSFGGNKGFLDNKMNINANMSLSLQTGASTYSFQAGGSYRYKENHVVNLQLNSIINNNKYNPFSDLTCMLGYSYMF